MRLIERFTQDAAAWKDTRDGVAPPDVPLRRHDRCASPGLAGSAVGVGTETRPVLLSESLNESDPMRRRQPSPASSLLSLVTSSGTACSRPFLNLTTSSSLSATLVRWPLAASRWTSTLRRSA